MHEKNSTHQPSPFRIYRDIFAPGFCPYILQNFGSNWKEINTTLRNFIVWQHLNRELWCGVKGRSKLSYGLLDIDSNAEDVVARIIDHMHFLEGQYIVCSSPSFWVEGSVHFLFRPWYKDRKPSIQAYHDIVDRSLPKGCRIEVYPQENRKIRLPFGKGQYILTEDFEPQTWLSWQEQLDQFLQLAPYDLYGLALLYPARKRKMERRYDRQTSLVFQGDPGDVDDEGARLYKYGLQEKGTRNHAMMSVAYYLYRQGMDKSETFDGVMEWVRTKHNNLSQEVNRGNWQQIRNEAHGIVKSIWKKYANKDGTRHELPCIAYDCDVIEAGKLFPGNRLYQKYYFNLVLYYRARAKRYKRVYCSRQGWCCIASKRNYCRFREELIKRGIMEIDDHCKPGEYPRAITRFDLPDTSNGHALMKNGRYIDTYDEAVRLAFSSTVQVSDALGLKERTARRLFRGK